MDIFLIIIGILVILLCAFSVYMFLWMQSLDTFTEGIINLLARTLDYYYKTEDIQPRAINWGIDIIWNPEYEEDISEKKGFITLYYGSDSGVDTPIDDIEDADKLSGEIIKTVQKYLHDKELK